MMGRSVPSPHSEDSVRETIGQRLRRLRSERGLSQRELAEPGVSYAYISRIEAGTRQPSVKALRKLARKLGISASYLETGLEISEEEQREMRLADAELEVRLARDTEGAVAKLRALLDEAIGAGDAPSATRARIVLGSAELERGRPADAIALLEDAAESGDVVPSARPDVFAQLGRAYAMLGQLDRSIGLYERCLAEIDENEPENVASRVRFAALLSYALADAGQLQRAQEVLTEIVDRGQDLADTGTQIKLYWSLARLAFMRGQHATSLGYARRALALVEATEDTVQLGRAHLMCGAILVRQGKADEARTQLDRAEPLLGHRPAPVDFAYLRTEQARCAVLQHDGATAAAFARDALDALGETDAAERGAAWLALAEARMLQRDVDGALEAYRRSVDCLEQAGKLQEAAEALRTWGRSLREAGHEREALDVLDRAADLAVRAGRTEARAEA